MCTRLCVHVCTLYVHIYTSIFINKYIYIYTHIYAHRFVDELEESLLIGQHLHDGQYPNCSWLTLSILCLLVDLATFAFTGRIGKSYLDGVQSHMWLFKSAALNLKSQTFVYKLSHVRSSKFGWPLLDPCLIPR